MSFNQLENHINFIDTKPSLISKNTLDQLNKLIHIKTLTFSEKFIESLQIYWYVYLILTIFIIFVIWKYKTKKEAKENFFYDDNDKINEPIQRPTFNPHLPVNQQISYVRYLPDEYFKGAINNDIQDINYKQNLINLEDNIDSRYNQFQQPLINSGPFYNNVNPNEIISDINLQNNRMLNSKNINDM